MVTDRIAAPRMGGGGAIGTRGGGGGVTAERCDSGVMVKGVKIALFLEFP